MKRALSLLVVALLLAPALPVMGSPSVGGDLAQDGGYAAPSGRTPPTGPAPFANEGGRLIENLGQWPDRVRFVARTSFGEAAFMHDGVMYMLEGGRCVKVAFSGGAMAEPVGGGTDGALYNYIHGRDPAGWVTGARCFDEVLYEDVWPDVDVRYRLRGGALKYDVMVGEDGDTSTVGFDVEGHERLSVEQDRLGINLPDGSAVVDRDLVAWYSDGEPVHVAFEETASGYGFAVEREPGRALVIDPVVVRGSTYLGGTYDEVGEDVAVDEEGNVYVTGTTESMDYPVTVGAFDTTYCDHDVFVTKLDWNCSQVLWSTYIGGSGEDNAVGIEVDDASGIYVTGVTYSTDLPVTSGALSEELNMGVYDTPSDVFVLKLAADGTSLDYSTYVGGSFPDQAMDMKVHQGRAHVVGRTDSDDFPLEAGNDITDHGTAMLFVLDETGTGLVDTQFWGGYGYAEIHAIDVRPDGEVVVGGWTGAYKFETTPGAYRENASGLVGWLSRYSPQRDEIVFTTFTGGYWCKVYAIALDGEGDVYFGGDALNPTQPSIQGIPTTDGAYDTTPGGRSEGYVSKLDANGTRLIYSTMVGGDGDDYVNAIAVNSEGKAVVVGKTREGTNHTVTTGCHDPDSDGIYEGFLLALNHNMTEALYHVFLGGTFDDGAQGLDITRNDLVVVTGYTDSRDFATSEGAFQRELSGARDAFIAVVGVLDPPSAPRDLRASGGEGYIDLAWRPPEHDGGHPVEEHVVLRGTDWMALEPLEYIGNVTGFRDDDVRWGQTYYYRVVAAHRQGLSPPSNVVGGVSLTVPDGPWNLTALVDCDHIVLRWEAPNFTGGRPLEGYNLYRGTPGGNIGPLQQLPTQPRSFIDLDVEDGTVYVYQLASATDYGESRERCEVTVRTTGVPTPPRHLDHTYGDRFIRLTWSEPEDDWDLTVLRYHVYRRDDGGPTERRAVVTHPATSFVDEMVDLGTVYTYYVTAENLKGESAPSNIIDAVATVPPGPPGGVRATAGAAFVRVTWSPPAFDGAMTVTEYRVYLLRDDGNSTLLGGVGGTGPLVFLHEAPYDGSVRRYLVTAVNAEGEGEPGQVAETQLYQLPGPPRDVTVAWGDGELVLEWARPDADGGTPLVSFVLYRAQDDGFTPLATLSPGTLRYLDDTVENGREYTYRVTATNIAGEGEPSAEASGMPAGPPLPPTGVSAEGLNGSVRVTWGEPEDTGGRRIDGYRLFRISEGMEAQMLADLGPEAREHLVEDLVNGNVYLYAVRAHTEAGVSELSQVVEVTPAGAPGPVVGLVAFWMGDHVHVTWSAPLDDGGSHVLGYRIRKDDGDWVEVDGLVFIDDNVEWEASYNYTVHALTGVDRGPGVTVGIVVPREPEEPPEAADDVVWPYIATVVVMAGVLVALVVLTRPRVERGRDLGT